MPNVLAVAPDLENLKNLDILTTKMSSISNFQRDQALRAMQASHSDNVITPTAFRRNLRNHSTPLKVNGTNQLNGTMSAKKRRKRKRRWNDSNEEIIDLTPKKPKLPSSYNHPNDSDVEIIEPEPPTIIDLVEDETNCCDALTTDNAATDIESVSNNQEIQNNSSGDNGATISVDSPESTVNVNLNGEAQASPDSIAIVDENETLKDNVIEGDSLIDESLPLYIKDASGGGNFKPPLYDLVSDDSFCFDTPNTTPVSSQNTLVGVDDSVIFVSETLEAPKRSPKRTTNRTPNQFLGNEDFIPINNRGFNKLLDRLCPSSRGKVTKRKSPKKTPTGNTNQKSDKPVTNVATKTTPKYISKPVTGIKRMVLIDGNNVAFGHTRNKEYSVEGISICLNYFLEKGYDAKAIVPQMRLKKSRSSNPELLAKLEMEGKIVFSPCKTLPSGQFITSYDDRFILDFAADCDAAVISNDQFRDLSKESEKYRHIVSTRVIGFTFLNDIIKFPQDPYGHYGPSLDEILNGKEKVQSNA